MIASAVAGLLALANSGVSAAGKGNGPEVSIPPLRPDGVTPKAIAVSTPHTDDPDRLNGKIFFSDSKGNDYECSGTAVNSDNKSVVWTAGHCVHSGAGGGFYKNWVFVPGYFRGDAPYGRWTAGKLLTTGGWAKRRAPGDRSPAT